MCGNDHLSRGDTQTSKHQTVIIKWCTNDKIWFDYLFVSNKINNHLLLACVIDFNSKSNFTKLGMVIKPITIINDTKEVISCYQM